MSWRHFVGNDKYHFFNSLKVYRAWYDYCHDDRAMLRINKDKYLLCLKNESIIKMCFTPFDTLITIKEKIDNLETKIKNKYLYL